jgi:hypothetical protein
MQVNNACMFYAPYASIVVWKSQNQNGAKTLVKLGAIYFCFFDNYWSSTPTYNIQHTQNNLPA